MKPFLILSHGLESGPDATKVAALAKVAAARNVSNVRPDYRDLDVGRDVRGIDARIARLKSHAPVDGPVVLAGSSMGAFISALASTELHCVGLFLIALPVVIPGYARPLTAANVPTTLVHAWDDELCPVDATIDFARARGDAITVLRDDHRLSRHVDVIAEQFRLFLEPFA
ncbi:MAG: alpha/beta hydrolase [Proteobacteria bacterium]|nr:alpha/beta hydrolase [Pseudomonadota bacterium]